VTDYSFADEDVMKLYLCLRHGLKGISCVREAAVTKISEIEATTMEHLRLKSPIPLVSHTQTVPFLEDLVQIKNWNKTHCL
jgi:hypothetical protein